MENSNARAAFLAVAFLCLLTFADSVTDCLLPALGNEAQTQPGFWNLGTLAIVLRGVSDLIGQTVLGYLISSKSKHWALNFNISSILAAGVVTLLSLTDHRPWLKLAAVGGPLIKCIGGGSHASTFLSLILLRDQEPVHLRSTYYYATGAVTVLAQSLGPFVASKLVERSHLLPGILSALCCFISYGIVDFLKHSSYNAKYLSQDDPNSVRTPLLSTEQQNHQYSGKPTNCSVSRAEHLTAYFSSHSILGSSKLAFIPKVFFLMAICKSTRPLFTTYIQHRDNTSPTQAEGLWLLRSVMSIVIFGVILPLVVLSKTSSSDTINLHLARVSVLFISAGAFMIGLSGSFPAIISALAINTIGVATDLNILAFASTLFKSSDAGSVLMPIASIESAGTLLGIGVLYPIFQWSTREDLPFLAGGAPYYVCGTLYAITAGFLWSSKSSRQETEP